MNDEQSSSSAGDPRDLAAGHALGILTPEEQARYEQYLATNPEARSEADEFSAVAQALAASAPAVAPSPALKADLMALIATTPQLADETTGATQAPPVLRAVDPAAPEEPASARHSAETRARGRWFARPAVYLSAAAAAAVIIVGGVTLPPLLSPDASQTQQLTALEEIRSAPDAQETTGAVATGEEATLVWSSSLGRSALVVDDLAALPDDKTYELWYIGSSGAVPAGIFDGGDGRTVVPLEGTLADGAVVAVTVEDAGGADAPTTDPILAIPTA
ncbi:Anti-sigma-K factor RskA [Rathayibacter oskolensis]|uniref:Regulator of SigK n=1 Tax=Rathayibacter oskolensis TaxID=1891671 RepID=A0A1X7N302_9MICO|nr:anti-sigma factor [Rathayibacter oskolensis]SMH31751.1 Anti-sigma-K factor RskA [Rathayibacter oskolensis]